MADKMRNILKKIKEMAKTTKKEGTWIDKNPKQYKALKKMIEKINEMEDREQKVDVVRGLTLVFLMFTELSCIERLGILSCIEGQVKDGMRNLMMLQAIQKNDEKPQSSQAEGGYIW